MQDYKNIITELKDVLDKFSLVKSTFLSEANFKEIVDKRLVDYLDRIKQIVKRKNNKFSNAESIIEEVTDAIEILSRLMHFSLYAREEEWKDLIYKLDKKKLRNRPKVEDVLALNFKDKRNCKILEDLTRQIQAVGSLIEDI